MTISSPPAVVLYGPPAVGKSTITSALHNLDHRFVLFPVVKSGPGRTAGYTMLSAEDFDSRVGADDFVFTWERYNSRYAVSRAELSRLARDGLIPVVHLGSDIAVDIVTSETGWRWVVVQLWARREVCAERAEQRGTSDILARMAAYDQTSKLDTAIPALTLDTEEIDVAQAAQRIRSAALCSCQSSG